MQISINQETNKVQSLLKVWARLQHELLYILWGVMDLALLTPFGLALMGWARFWPPGQVFFLLLLLMLLAFNLGRLMSSIGISIENQRTLMAIGLMVTIVILIRTLLYNPQSFFDMRWIGQFLQNFGQPGNTLWARDIMVFFLTVLVWARGIQMVNRNYTIHRIGLRLRIGGLILAPIVIWAANGRLLWDATPFLLLFFVAGLTAVALIRAEEVEQGQSGVSASLNPRWLAAIFIAALFITLTAGVIALLISGEPAGIVIGWLAPIWVGLQFVVSSALYTLAFILGEFASILISVLGVVGQWLVLLSKIVGKWLSAYRALVINSENGINESNSQATFTPGFGEEIIADLSPALPIIVPLLMIAVILMVALIVSRIYQPTAVGNRLSGHLADNPPDDLEKDSFGQRLLQKLGIWRGWGAAVSIRRIYRNMLRAAEAVGYPRLESETPYEYLPSLAKAWPDHQPEIQLITAAYVKVRYGELPETRSELDEIKQAWQRLEQARPIESTPDIKH